MARLLRSAGFVLLFIAFVQAEPPAPPVAVADSASPAPAAIIPQGDSLAAAKIARASQIANSGAIEPATTTISPGALAVRMSVGLAVVLVLIWGAWRIGRRIQGVEGTTNLPVRNLQLLEALPLGRGRRILLVRAAGKVLVVGEGETGVSRLSELSDDDGKVVLARADAIGPAQFSATVDQLLARFRRNTPVGDKS